MIWEVLGGKHLHQENLSLGPFISRMVNLRNFEISPPPILKVRVQKDILKHFQSINDNPKSINLIGKASMQWFENYNGIGTMPMVVPFRLMSVISKMTNFCTEAWAFLFKDDQLFQIYQLKVYQIFLH